MMDDTTTCRYCGAEVPAGKDCQRPEDADECPYAEENE